MLFIVLFDHNSLYTAIRFDSKAQVAAALRTAYLFGAENVDVIHGWTVPLGKKYQESALRKLAEKIISMKSVSGGKIVALDAVLWDIAYELLHFAKSHELDMHASTSDFRNFTNLVFIGNLVEMSKIVQTFFKTDEPAKIRKILSEAYDADELDLSCAVIIDHSDAPPATTKGEALDLTSTTIMSTVSIVNNIKLERLPKPGQEISEDYVKSILSSFSDGLTKFINQLLEGREEELVYAEDSSIDLVELDLSQLSGLDLLQYYYCEL